MVYQDMMGSSCSQGDLGQTWGGKKKKKKSRETLEQIAQGGLRVTSTEDLEIRPDKYLSWQLTLQLVLPLAIGKGLDHL